MNMRALWPISIAAFVLLASQSVFAASMSCGVHRIQDAQRHGPGMYEVLKKCGEPTFRQGNTWIYEKSRSKYVLVFRDNGALSTISQGRL